MTKLQIRRSDSWLLGVRDEREGGEGCDYKGQHEGYFCGDGIVLNLECGGSCKNVHM